MKAADLRTIRSIADAEQLLEETELNTETRETRAGIAPTRMPRLAERPQGHKPRRYAAALPRYLVSEK